MSLKFRLPAAAVLSMALFAGAAGAADTSAAFTLPPLPYAANALEPAIDAQTMTLHHDKHHQAYVDNLNGKVKDFPALQGAKIEAVMAQVSKYDAAVRNNGGGHYNHSLFWTIMAPVDKGGKPGPALQKRIAQDFKSQDEMVKQFSEMAGKNFGSGWTWLIVKPDGKLAITNTPNQDNPLMDVVQEKGTPILALDTWEHAYYLKYQNKRPEYVKAFWSVVNWNEVTKRYDQAVK